MADQTKKKQDDANTGVSPLVAGVAGAVIGAGLGVAGAVVLEDKDKRDEVKKVLNSVKDVVEEKLETGKEEVKKVTNSSKG